MNIGGLLNGKNVTAEQSKSMKCMGLFTIKEENNYYTVHHRTLHDIHEFDCGLLITKAK